MASPKFGPWWVLWICVCLWFLYAPKCSNYALIKLLFGLCKSVWIIDLLVNRFSPHPGAPTCPSTPKVLRTKERAPILSPFDVFTFWFVVESINELGGASNSNSKMRVHLGMCGLIPSHFLALPRVWMWLPGCILASHLSMPLGLVVSPRLGLWQWFFLQHVFHHFLISNNMKGSRIKLTGVI